MKILRITKEKIGGAEAAWSVVAEDGLYLVVQLVLQLVLVRPGCVGYGARMSAYGPGPRGESRAEGVRAKGLAEVQFGSGHPERYCPNCSVELKEHRCKLICEGCGFYLSCSDFY